MVEWDGWSPHQGQVDTTRVIAALLASVSVDGQTDRSTGEVIPQLVSPQRPPHQLKTLNGLNCLLH